MVKNSREAERENNIQSERDPPLTVDSSQERLCVAIRPLQPSTSVEWSNSELTGKGEERKMKW